MNMLIIEKPLSGGVGLCSQHAIIASEVLREKGIDVRIIQLSKHIVAMAHVGDKADEWWVLDPTYGVVIKHNIHEIENAPEIIRPYYLEKGTRNKTIRKLIRMFGMKGKRFFKGGREYQLTNYRIERISYPFIWIIPLFLMIPFFHNLFRYRYYKKPGKPRNAQIRQM